MIPLNQTYRINATLEEREDVRRHHGSYETWCRAEVAWNPSEHLRAPYDSDRVKVGRSYDCALALTSLDFQGADVCELGARDSFLSSYLTDRARSVHVSDLFGDSFRGLGSYQEWSEWWKRGAPHPDRLTPEVQDMSALTCADESFDVVVSFSAIEHIRGSGDVRAVREMARVCRPGGYVVLSTDVSDEFRRVGGYYYGERALFARLVRPTRMDIHGDHDLTWEGADKKPHRSGAFLRSCAFFALKAPP